MSSYPAGLSLCMIVRDEAAFLADCLRSVAGVVDEICIVDTGSRDDTVAIAESFGARVTRVAWRDDFAWARNEALALAQRRWILALDADERLDPASRDATRAVGSEPTRLRGKWIACRNLTDDIKGSGAMTNAIVRIFPNDPRIRYRNKIHEFPALDGSESGLPSDRTAIEIVHHGYLGAVLRERGKAERNLRLSRAAAEAEPDDPFHHYNLAMSLSLAGDRDGAIAALERVRDLTASTPRGYRANALVMLADLYAEHRGDTFAAARAIDECLRIAPQYSSAHFTHGKLLARSGRLFDARDAFGRAIAAGAYDGEQFVVDNEIAVWKAPSEIAATLMQEKRYAEALKWLELASQARPSAAPLVLNRAKCHEALGDRAAAEQLFSAAFTAYADERSAIEWVNFLFRQGRDAEALAAVEPALDLVSAGYQRVFLGAAAASRLRSGDAAGAQAYVERALAIGERDESAAVLRALAVQLAEPRLVTLLTPLEGTRAKGLRIAYTPQR